MNGRFAGRLGGSARSLLSSFTCRRLIFMTKILVFLTFRPETRFCISGLLFFVFCLSIVGSVSLCSLFAPYNYIPSLVNDRQSPPDW